MTTYRFLNTWGVSHESFRTLAQAQAYALRIGARSFYAL